MADAETLSEEYSKQLLPNTIVQLIAATFGILGNCLVILMYTKYVKDKMGSRYFIPVLAVVDLVGSVSNATQFHLDNTMRYIYPDVFLCKMMSFLIVFTGGFSAHLILAIALQRYLIICRPFGQQMTQKLCRIAVLIIFLISVGYASPILKFNGIYKLRSLNTTGNYNISFCHIDDGTDSFNVMIPYLGFLLFLSLINIFITFIFYVPVTKTIYDRLSPARRNRAKNVPDGKIVSKETQMSDDGKNITKPKLQANDESMVNGSPEQKARKNISVMFLVIIIVYIVSYLTSLVTQIHSFASTEERKGYIRNIYFFCLRFNLLNHIANPYIYWFYDLKFRNELRRICCRSFRR
ncbi:somatostatin receptor type 5-like [Saccostrea echinata]|uniref:somatostatin receptor type 5-like n=1 Tax=Saccostrea echinata TaxID=191078 RepID=UPI002A805566|nr:somatostatin receptor type 5-like [Saccostrea echinata]